jgi:hypothetical protein
MDIDETNTIDADRNERMNYYVFKCSTIHPKQRPKGKKLSEGCGRACIKASKHPLRYINSKGEEEILQGRCMNHPENESGTRKQRLNEDYLKVKNVKSRAAAKYAIDFINDELDEDKPKPNEKPEGVCLYDIEIPSNPLGSSAQDLNWDRRLKVKTEGDRLAAAKEEGDEEAYWDDLASKGLI